MNVYLLFALILALFIILYLVCVLKRVQGQLALIEDALEDIRNGNLNRRILATKSDLTKQICYGINEIALNSQVQLTQQKQADQAYRSLMTGLSHDVKTPLASLVGYLEAIESGLVTGKEKEDYIQVASDKAHRLKEFVTALFEWVKLDAGEQIFHFDAADINELSRNMLADWIPVFEKANLKYEIEIPENEYVIQVDSNAYIRIVSNLLQNILVHSKADHMKFELIEDAEQVKITVTDNGQGISGEDLPHVFERLYQCDHARSARGNGLGLSIARELVIAHKGTITATSAADDGTAFIIVLPKAL